MIQEEIKKKTLSGMLRAGFSVKEAHMKKRIVKWLALMLALVFIASLTPEYNKF